MEQVEGGAMFLYSYLSLHVCVRHTVSYLSLYVCVIAGGHHGGAPQAQGHQVQPLLQADAFEPGS